MFLVSGSSWKTQRDFVGHKKAVSCVRFCPSMMEKIGDENGQKTESVRLYFKSLFYCQNDLTNTSFAVCDGCPGVEGQELFRVDFVSSTASFCCRGQFCHISQCLKNDLI